MANIPATQLSEHIQGLLEKREQHIDAITSIDQTLAGVSSALGDTTTAPAKSTKVAAASAPKAPAARGKKRRGRGGFAVNAFESILAFVKQHKNPTSPEINQHFKDEGRASTADNALSQMVKAKKLKRTPLGEGIRGSRYSIP